MIIIADAGPLIHLHWIGATEWALPSQAIDVVEEVWTEVKRIAPDALKDKRLCRRKVAGSADAELGDWRLDPGEKSALNYALQEKTEGDVLVLCDELDARLACRALAIPVTGSIGLIVKAHRAGRVTRTTAETALRDLPHRGRLYVDQQLIDEAVAEL